MEIGENDSAKQINKYKAWRIRVWKAPENDS